MIIISQNLSNYKIPLPEDTIYRVNLAWVNDLIELHNILKKHNNHKIFLDLPINRTKPPNNSYTINDLIPVFDTYQNIKYLAISNVESTKDLISYINLMPKTITIVPKIENVAGVTNIQEITNVLPYNEKIIMLDHDDLYSSLSKNNIPSSKFKDYVNRLVRFCEKNHIILLRTIGVIFSESEKRVTQYVK